MEENGQGVYNENVEHQNPGAQYAFDELPTSALWWRETVDDVEMTRENDSGFESGAMHHLAGVNTTEISLKKNTSKASRLNKERRDNASRVKNPDTWKVNVKKTARLKGEEYVGKGGKVVPAKSMGPPCDCRMLCGVKIDEEIRSQLHDVFWKTCNWDQRKQYIAMSVKEAPKKRSRVRGKSAEETRRQVTLTYSLLVKNECVTVCKTMFLRTFSISEKFVRHAMEKKRTSPGGIIGPDQRGRHTPITKKSEEVKNRVREHIKSFPSEKSDNPRECSDKRYLDGSLNIAAMHKLYLKKCMEGKVPESDIVKESYYREMFKSEFNLGFKAPPSDKNEKHMANKARKNS